MQENDFNHKLEMTLTHKNNQRKTIDHIQNTNYVTYLITPKTNK